MSATASTANRTLIRVGHSPDPDDAFMFHALTNDKVDTGNYQFTHQLQDIETLNHRALRGELELTAVSLHGYSFMTDKYALCACGCSMGDNYGPMIVTRQPSKIDDLRGKTIAIPGTLTTAFLSLRLCLKAHGFDCVPADGPAAPEMARYIIRPFDEILNVVEKGEADAGLIIHEGQLTYQNQGLSLVVDLGQWWMKETGLPLPLGGNAIRKDLGAKAMEEVTALLKKSIEYALAHRKEALDYAMKYGRDLDVAKSDKFVGMYVNDWTIDFGPRGREAVALLLKKGHEAGIIPNPVELEFIG